jgi:hypothetical protein
MIMTENKPITTGQEPGLDQEPKQHIPGNKTTIQLERETLALLNECKGIEAQRRGTSWMKHDNFIRFACRLYKKAQARDECRTVIYLASKEES